MNIKNSRTWMILIAVLLLVLLGGGVYWYVTRGEQVVAPADSQDRKDFPDFADLEGELEETRAGVVDIDYLRQMHPKVKLLNQLDDRIRGYARQQDQKQSELATTRKQVEAQYSGLDMLLGSQIKEIQGRYQKMIDEKTESLQKELTAFEETAMKEAAVGIQRKQENLQEKGKEQIERFQEKQVAQLSEAERKVYARYSPQILNLQLKLQMVRLSEDEQKKYRDELEKLDVEQQQQLQDERAKLNRETNEYIQAKQAELNQEMQAFQNQTKQNADKSLKEKQAQLDAALKAYIKEMEAAMQAEISGKQGRIDEQKKNGLNRAQQQIESEISKNDQLLSSKVEEARKRQIEILNEIDREIKEAVAEAAQENGIEVILTDFTVNAKAVDLTDLVLRKLRQ